jgi:hypothetical protein
MLKLNPDPTFAATLRIRLPGGGVEELELEFKHRTRSQLLEFAEAVESHLPGGGNPIHAEREHVADCVVGWRHESPYSRVALFDLLEQYPGLASAILAGYMRELMNARAGN